MDSLLRRRGNLQRRMDLFANARLRRPRRPHHFTIISLTEDEPKLWDVRLRFSSRCGQFILVLLVLDVGFVASSKRLSAVAARYACRSQSCRLALFGGVDNNNAWLAKAFVLLRIELDNIDAQYEADLHKVKADKLEQA